MSTRPATVLAALASAALLLGCAPPPELVPPAASPTPAPSVSPTPDADDDEDDLVLTGAVADLRTTVAAVRTALEATVAGDDRSATAAALLVAEPGAVLAAPATAPDPAATPAPDAARPVLPGPESSREETVTYGDLLTGLLAASRQAGAAGEPVQRFLADPLAGDLGAWQRAPADQLALVAAAADEPDLDAAALLVLDLDGEAVRALAWTAFAANQPAFAPEAAERALAHLTIVEAGLDRLGG